MGMGTAVVFSQFDVRAVTLRLKDQTEYQLLLKEALIERFYSTGFGDGSDYGTGGGRGYGMGTGYGEPQGWGYGHGYAVHGED